MKRLAVWITYGHSDTHYFDGDCLVNTYLEGNRLTIKDKTGEVVAQFNGFVLWRYEDVEMAEDAE